MKEFLRYFTFTKSEARVIIFTISILVFGFSVKYYKQVISNKLTAYDFSKDDSVFLARSDKISDTDSTEKDQQFPEKSETNDKKSYFQGVVDLNTATKEQLVDLPGIGESTADKIIAYRTEHKGFKKIEDLMNVKGIGKKKFESIKGHIKVE